MKKVVAITVICALFTGCATQTASYSNRPELFRSAQEQQAEQERQRQQAQYEAERAARPAGEKIGAAMAVITLAVVSVALASGGGSTGCQHTWQRAKDGSRCGNRAADVRPGGR